MKVGDTLDPTALGHSAIDLKSMMREKGYVVPQTSASSFAKIPDDVQMAISKIGESQKLYGRLEVDRMICGSCGTDNSGHWRKDTVTSQEFFVCGACNQIIKVR